MKTFRNIAWFSLKTGLGTKRVIATPFTHRNIEFFAHRRENETIITHNRTGRAFSMMPVPIPAAIEQVKRIIDVHYDKFAPYEKVTGEQRVN